MKASRKPYLKGKTIFIISLIVIAVTAVTVWLTGINYNRALTSNFYISLSIIGTLLFAFMTYGLYKGLGLQDDFPNYRNYTKGSLFNYQAPGGFDSSETDVGDGLSGLILSILLWIVMSILILVAMLLLEAIFWFSLFIIIMMLYWVFFRALRQVFKHANMTSGNFTKAVAYSLSYTFLYLGWIFGIVFLTEII